ncbi:gliding motility-associated C-terminal domain-containing protein [Costertonia aggregata]|uniref:Gliding motility-associated C-terminal domain-containing protein n=2 Tax=Costertonia aggregata TaxID=343403 RepID=A0A7H9AUW6_9FLAO|nr:gliding motility-associated C-terminal domain-containing protein [Costertonia aggregata]
MGTSQTYSQTLNAPTAAPNQTPPIGSTPWSSACASSTFNDYWVNFKWTPPVVNSGNEFILELSDASGDFSNPIELAKDGTKNTSFDFFFQFTLPTDTRGEGYKMRVRSTDPAIIGAESEAFAMYYKDFDSPSLISEDGNGTIPPGGAIQICDGASIVLAPHNIPAANTYQYNWYRSGTLLAEKSFELTVNQVGMYQVEVDYGTCSISGGGTLSNIIDVTLGSSLGLAINPPSKTDLCSGETASLQANITGQGLTYTWFKDGAAITSPTVDADTYIVDASVAGFEGDYTVEISGPDTCLELSSAITITNAGIFTVTRSNPENMVLLPSQPLNLSVTTTAGTPVYQWYRNGSAISGANAASLEVSQEGTYYAEVSQSGGACASTAINSETTTVVSPASFVLVADYASTYAACENPSIVLEVETINAVATDGTVTDVTSDLISSFTYQWKKDGVAIPGATSSNISLTDITENGNYEVDGEITTYTATSNPLPVQLIVNETLTITSTGVVSCGPSEIITMTTTTDLTGQSFDWFRNGTNLNNGDAVLNITEPGTYQLVLDRNGCPLRSNEIIVSPLDPALISLDSDTDVIFPEGTTRTVTASGGTAYQWFDANNVAISNSSSVTLTEEGEYTLLANIDNCQITRQLTVTYQDTFRVPNVITVNGDGINDQWVIPNTYSNDPEVNVIIYNGNGEEVFNEFDYQNNWPASSVTFQKQNMVFYYTIRNANETLKQGTITVIR